MHKRKILPSVIGALGLGLALAGSVHARDMYNFDHPEAARSADEWRQGLDARGPAGLAAIPDAQNPRSTDPSVMSSIPPGNPPVRGDSRDLPQPEVAKSAEPVEPALGVGGTR